MGSNPKDEDSRAERPKRSEQAGDGGNVSNESSSLKWTQKEMEEAVPLPLPEIPDDSDDD
jgi:hypothetical protein